MGATLQVAWAASNVKKLSINQYLPLMKITTRVTSWSTKLVSYTGRLQVIKLSFWVLKLICTIFSHS